MKSFRFISQLYKVISEQKSANLDYINLFESKIEFIENHIYIHKKLEELEEKIKKIQNENNKQN